MRRSKSIGGDIGKPPSISLEPKAIKLKKVINENGVCNGLALTNMTNKLDNTESDDDNGNRTITVAELRKKFDQNYAAHKPANGLYIEGVAIKTADKKNTDINNKANNLTNTDPDKRLPKPEPETHTNTKLFVARPAKCSKTAEVDPSADKNQNKNDDAQASAWAADNMDVSDSKSYHTSNFASYIPSKGVNNDNEAMNEGGDSDGEMESSENNHTDIFYQRNINNVSS